MHCSGSLVPLSRDQLQYIPRNMHTVFASLCFVVVIHWLIFPYPSGLLHWHCGNLTIAPVPAKQPWYIWINTSCEFIMNDCITTTKQSTTKPCAYFLGYTVCRENIYYSVSSAHLSRDHLDTKQYTIDSYRCVYPGSTAFTFICHAEGPIVFMASQRQTTGYRKCCVKSRYYHMHSK